MSVALQIMWNRLISIVEEQAQALIRTAFSTSVREAGDLSAGVYDESGAMLAQAVTGTPGHVNAMAEAVRHFIREIGAETFAEGDVYVTNDPWMGTGHLHDITVVTPVFHSGRHVAFFACTAHVVDIGGRGFGAEGESLYEEGFQIPIMRLIDRGTPDATLLQLLRVNTREPDQLVGDVFALAACNDVGRRRLLSMMDEYALGDLSTVAPFILDASRRATLDRIAALPRGEASASMTTDGYATPIVLAVRVSLNGDHVAADFAGTSPPDPKGINVPLVYTRAYACYALKIAIAPEVPNNTGSLEPFRITAPEGTILNAVRPHPVSLRHVIGHLIPDTVFGALTQLLPGIPAEGAGALCNFQVSLRPTTPEGRRSEVLCFNSGGTGARPHLDGLNATAFPSGVMTMPVEATEHAGPVVIWRKELRPRLGRRGLHARRPGPAHGGGRAPRPRVHLLGPVRPGPEPGARPRRGRRGRAHHRRPVGRHEPPRQEPDARGRGHDRAARLPRRRGPRRPPRAGPRGGRARPPPRLRERGGGSRPLRVGAVRPSYDVVVVGGGMIGSAIAWWTARDPAFKGRILVVERDPSYAQAASSLSHSCIRQQFGSEVNVRISRFGAEFIHNFREFMGDPEAPAIKLQSFGYLYLADAPAFADVLRDNALMQNRLGAATRILSPEEITARWPFYDMDGITCGSHNAVDEGYFDGATIFDWFRRKARAMGVDYVTDEVAALDMMGPRVTGVRLASGARVGAASSSTPPAPARPPSPAWRASMTCPWSRASATPSSSRPGAWARTCPSPSTPRASSCARTGPTTSRATRPTPTTPPTPTTSTWTTPPGRRSCGPSSRRASPPSNACASCAPGSGSTTTTRSTRTPCWGPTRPSKISSSPTASPATASSRPPPWGAASRS
jgi:N-methylhydantoinase B